jgi:hypothetical protein
VGAGVLASLLAVAGIVLVAVGEPVWGLAILVAEIAALVLAFYGVRSQATTGKSLADRRPPIGRLGGTLSRIFVRIGAISLCHRSGAPPPRDGLHLRRGQQQSGTPLLNRGCHPVMSCGNALRA